MSKSLAKLTRKTGRLFLVAGRKIILHPGDALLLCRMAWWVGVLSIAARWCPLPRALRIVSGAEPRHANVSDIEVQTRLARSIDLVLSADFLVFTPICWKRAAVLRRYLSLNGIATRIVFGVRNGADGKVSGHAWLESGGRPILESSPPEYVVTYRFPANKPVDSKLAVFSHE